MSYGNQGFPRLSDAQVEQLKTLVAAGNGNRRISAEMGVSSSVVARARWYLGIGPTNPTGGRPRRKQATPLPVPPAARVSGGKPYAVLMAEAKAEYLALLDREKEATKGGRPPRPGGGKNIVVPRSRRRPDMPQVQRESGVDLTTQLQPYYGRSA